MVKSPIMDLLSPCWTREGDKMKTILVILIILSFLLGGIAGAVTLTYTPTFPFGPDIGFYNPGTIQAGDLYATDDLLVGDDGEIGGDLSVAGAISVGGAVITGGKYNGNLVANNLKSNATIYAVTTINSGGTATLNRVVSNSTINGTTIKCTSISNSGTENIGGAVNIGGATATNDLTVNSTHTLAVTTADKLTVGGIIVPQKLIINMPYDKTMITASEINRSILIANAAWQITSIKEVHSVAESTATTLSIGVQKMTGAQTLVQGINLTTSNFNMKSTANTVVTGTLSTNSGVTTMAAGDRLGIICNMTGVTGAAEFRTGLITIEMKRV
jgi:hypothetical protein